MEKKTIEIKFLNQKVQVKSTSDQQITQEVVDLVNLKIHNAEKRGKGLAPHHVALLALLDIAEQYVKAKHRAMDHRKKITSTSAELIHLIDAELQ